VPEPAANRAGRAIARRVLALPELATARCVAAYAGLAGEPGTGELLAALHQRQVRVLLPAVRPDLSLDFREYTGVLTAGALGTVEPPPPSGDHDPGNGDHDPGNGDTAGQRRTPEAGARGGSGPARLSEADVIVVPAVAADRAGRRLGRGAGCYDRALATAPSTAFVVAIVYDHELLDELPDEPHDRRVGAVVTPERTWRCTAGHGTANRP
jgi:5-formyltetrahydrofolate cyclo-ligase